MDEGEARVSTRDEKALVSVVIPTYKRVKDLPLAIDSVLEQSYQPVEIIVVDDGSTDGTETMVQSRYPQVGYLRQSNRGPAAARNAGIKSASGQYIAFLDSDDRWTPRKLEQQIGLFRMRPDVGLVFSSVRFINRHGTTMEERRYDPSFRGRMAERLLSWSGIILSSVVVRRDVLDRVGLFEEDLIIGEDWDLYFRLAMEAPFDFIDEPLVLRLVHEGNLQNDFTKIEFKLQNELRVIERMHAHPGLSGDHCQTRKATLHRLLFSTGEWYFEQYRMGPARRYFLKALPYHPFQGRTYLLLFKSLLGENLLKIFQGMKKVMRHRLRQTRPSLHNQPARVLFVQDQAQIKTGSPQVLLDLLARLDRSRYCPSLLCGEAGEFTHALEGMGLPYHISRLVPLSVRSVPVFIASSVNLVLWMLRERIDLIHINSPLWRSGVILAARLLGIPVIQHVHTLWPEIEIDEPYFLPRVTRIVACSREAADRFAHRHRFVPKIRVVYNGISLEKIAEAKDRLRSEYGPRPDLLLVGIVGTLKPIKGQDFFLQMSRRVLDAGIEARFFIIGSDPLPGEPYLKKLHGLVSELGLSGRVWFTGFRKDNLDVIRSLDILVSASTEEAMPRNLIEAMALGRPVVATAVGGVPELVEEGMTGLLVPPQDAVALAGAVIRLARDPDLRRRLGEAGRCQVEERFTLDRFVRGIETVYSEVLA
ncbi:MAG: glycosyltransferase [Nitrospirae bacterium]|nr:glycosyltransferase [Nitrospirota bacterium]